MSLTGQSLAVVTGGAVRLGKAISLALAQAGYAVAIHYHNSREAADATLAEVQAMGMPGFLLQADLRKPEAVEALFDQVAAINLPLKLLVNSAAVMPRGNLMSMETEDWDDTLNLNLRGPWLCTREAARLMGERGGVIINISDSGASKAWTGFPAYVLSKAGLETLTRLLARTLAPHIRVNAVAPGLILPAEDMPVGEWNKLVERLPAGIVGNPEVVTQAILFLINNPYITGEVLVVDGGYQLI